mmetsp:Transcript_11958/g.33115  ORF Transcript_11958/g.33115 Transcript_11958/m.33115 type:complete len:293 (+) Transcript_11958:202-1080(+)|eukprot:CAMPEP_0168749060 /NCGR_PEP_ID=MMETSP0724-20121128/16510_1 /TAXON_ID=265536 /ORGANISM="Amphiprora sp., Strain CCMP467" /LENGTH=292 /DNA_ID=CAMNT_0008796935 /DNA_START=32 /DNA_END=910 /DNA_ORIENTATION=+
MMMMKQKLTLSTLSLLFLTLPCAVVHSFSAIPTPSSAGKVGTNVPDGHMELFPVEPTMNRIEGGGGTIRTYQVPPGVERLQYVIRSDGRPLKARVELWIGPIRRIHYCELDMMNGAKTPYRATLKFKPLGVTLRIGTTKKSSGEFPIMAGVYVPKPDESKSIGKLTQAVFEGNEKTLVQGGAIEGGHGAVRVFKYDETIKSMQLVIWSRDVGKKSYKAYIEVLNGPNNDKQILDLQCGGGTQPYHAVIQTPGIGEIRLYNKKYIEDGLFQIAMVPYEYNDYSEPSAAGNWYD